MPFVKSLSGFAEVPYQVPPWSLPVAPRMPQNKPREVYLVPDTKPRLYPKVLIAKCLPAGAEGPYQGQPLSPRKCFKNVLGLRVVFPLRGPGKPPGRKSPKNGEKLQNSPPRSDPRKWGKLPQKKGRITPNLQFLQFFCNFSHFRGSDRGGESCNFSPFFGDFHPSGFPGPLRENQLATYLVPAWSWKARLSARHVWKMQTQEGTSLRFVEVLLESSRRKLGVPLV